jgi:hypothetical protein
MSDAALTTLWGARRRSPSWTKTSWPSTFTTKLAMASPRSSHRLTGEPAEDHRDDADGKAAGDEDRETPAEGVSDDLWWLSEAGRAQHLASVVEGLIERAECHLLVKPRTVAHDEGCRSC